VVEERGRGKQANPEEEINKYLDILARDPQSRAFAPLAEAYRKAGLLDEAIETSREGLKNNPSYFGGRVALGRALFEKNLFSEAKDEFVQVVQAAPDNLMAQKLLGQSYRQLGSTAEAEKAFRMVLLLDPRDEEAQKSLDSLSVPAPAPAAAFEPPPVKSAAPEPPVRFEPEPEPEPEAGLESPPPPEPPPQPPVEDPEDPFFVDVEEEAGEEPAEESDLVFNDEEEAAAETSPPPPSVGEPVPAPEEELTTSTEPVFDVADMEAMADAAGEDEEILGGESDSPFEMFTREPKGEFPPPEEREESWKGEEIFEQTFDTEGLREETEEGIPIFDLADQAEESPPAEAAPPVASPAPPVPEPAAPPPPSDEEEMHAELEDEMHVFDLGEDLEVEVQEAAAPPPPSQAVEPSPAVEEAPPAPEPVEAAFGVEVAADLEEEIPAFDLAAELEEEVPAAAVPPAAGLHGGTFDTETLANLYVNQGFYDKAAGVYRRMMQDRPDDNRLRQKLEEVLSLQKLESSQPAPTASHAAPEPPAAAPPPPAPAPALPVEARMVPESTAAGEENPVIVELQRFLAQLKERRK
jgi:hypothetical protein